ncbi:MAG: hypothetical protein ACPGVD_11845, partial [Flavobacteriales bacterium]
CKGYSLKNYSFLYGQTYLLNKNLYHSFEFQFDRKIHSCLTRTNYVGFGASFSFGNNQQSFSFKGMINPTKFSLLISRKSILHPYLLVQANLVRENNSFANYKNNVSPGIGINLAWRIKNRIYIRPQFQVRYNVNEEYLKNKDGLRIDLRIGIGISSFRSKKNRYKK